MSKLREAAKRVLDAYCAIEPMAAVMEDLCAALAEPTSKPSLQVEPVAWIPVAEVLPKSGVKVLACYRNRLGNLRRIRAQWVASMTEEANADDAEACSEYDETTDTYYVAQGWYECIDNWGDYSSVAVTEGEVTHWMPLPAEPGAAPADTAPQRQPELHPVTGEQLPTSTAGWLHYVTDRTSAAWQEGYAQAMKREGRRQPLSDEEIDRVTDAQWAANNHRPVYAAHRAFARAIEAAHGITVEK